MNKKAIVALAALLLVALAPLQADAQRRGRPGSMRHSEAEARAKQEITRLSCKYIRDGVAFSGPIYMTGDAGGIKIGDAIIAFTGGRYMLSFDAAKFKIKKHAVMTDEERLRKGITKYDYDNSWENKKLGEDFEYGGKYATIEQYGQKWLILYDGDTENIYAKIPIGSVDDDSFELAEDDMLIRMSCR